MKEMQVDEKLFNLFIGWYNDNVENLYSESCMPADRVNFFNKKDELIAYVYLYMGKHYYIKEYFYKLMIKE